MSVTASVDGRVALNRSAVLMEPDAQVAWQLLHPPGAVALIAERRTWIESRYGYRVVLEGSGTFVTESTSPPVLPPPEFDSDLLAESYLPNVRDCRWFVVVDGRGRIRWSFKGNSEVRLLVLVCGRTTTRLSGVPAAGGDPLHHCRHGPR